jgi:hypothetical protein
MDNNLEIEIITAVEKGVEKFDSCSIKQAAQSVFYNDITLSEQKKLAKLIVRKHCFITESKGDEIIVKKNHLLVESGSDTVEKFEFLKLVIWAIAALAAYLVFKVFLPSLSK